MARVAPRGAPLNASVRPQEDMEDKAYKLTRDVAGEPYDFLVTTLLERGQAFGLVWREQLRFAETAAAVRAELQPLQLRLRKVDRWPGTRLVGHRASVLTYRCDPAARCVLTRPGSLFSWHAPSYPEDLWFVAEANSLLLASVAHQRQAWVFSKPLARVLGQRITLELEPREAGDAKYFELAV